MNVHLSRSVRFGKTQLSHKQIEVFFNRLSESATASVKKHFGLVIKKKCLKSTLCSVREFIDANMNVLVFFVTALQNKKI